MLRSAKYLGRAGQLVYQSVANGQQTTDVQETVGVPRKQSVTSNTEQQHADDGQKNEQQQQQRKPGQHCWLGENPGLFMAIGGSLAAGHQVAQLIFDRPDQERERDAADELADVLRPSQPWCTWRQVARTAIAQPMHLLTPHISQNVLAQPGALSTLVPGRQGRPSCETSVQTDSLEESETVEEATTRLSKAVKRCESAVANGIGVDLMRRGLEAEAVDRFQRAINTAAEHASASYNLGLCHALGRGTRKDMHKAVESWKVAAAYGHPGAAYQLGVCYVRGLGGLASDPKLGTDFIRVAADAAVPEAQLYVGLQLFKEGDMEHGLSLIKAAADADNAQAIAFIKRQSGSAASKQKPKSPPVSKRSVTPISKRALTNLWTNSSEDDDDDVCFESANEGDSTSSLSSLSDQKHEMMPKASTVADFRPMIMQQQVATQRLIQEL